MDWTKFFRLLDKLVHNIFLMSMGVLIFFTFMYINGTDIDPMRFAGNLMAVATYKTQAIAHLDDNISVQISDFCRGVPITEQAECVVYQVLPFYNYSSHNETIRSPDDYVVKGGVCRDSTVLYHTIFSRLGWYVYYDFSVPNHVFLTITKTMDNTSVHCVIDALTYNCETYNI